MLFVCLFILILVNNYAINTDSSSSKKFWSTSFVMDMERIRPILVSWVAALYDPDGFLHWGLNWWRMGHENTFQLDPLMRSVNYMDNGIPVSTGDRHIRTIIEILKLTGKYTRIQA